MLCSFIRPRGPYPIIKKISRKFENLQCATVISGSPFLVQLTEVSEWGLSNFHLNNISVAQKLAELEPGERC